MGTHVAASDDVDLQGRESKEDRVIGASSATASRPGREEVGGRPSSALRSHRGRARSTRAACREQGEVRTFFSKSMVKPVPLGWAKWSAGAGADDVILVAWVAVEGDMVAESGKLCRRGGAGK